MGELIKALRFNHKIKMNSNYATKHLMFYLMRTFNKDIITLENNVGADFNCDDDYGLQFFLPLDGGHVFCEFFTRFKVKRTLVRLIQTGVEIPRRLKKHRYYKECMLEVTLELYGLRWIPFVYEIKSILFNSNARLYLYGQDVANWIYRSLKSILHDRVMINGIKHRSVANDGYVYDCKDDIEYSFRGKEFDYTDDLIDVKYQDWYAYMKDIDDLHYHIHLEQ